MNRRSKGWTAAAIVVAALMVIGLITSWRQLLLPIIILGGIFLLYKFPPSFLGGRQRTQPRRQGPSARMTAAAPKTRRDRPRSKTVPFRVIEGGKDDDDVPKYH